MFQLYVKGGPTVTLIPIRIVSIGILRGFLVRKCIKLYCLLIC